MSRGVITLITDFGTQDGYVGTMKGVMLKTSPEVRLVDITHEIPPQDVFRAGFVLRNSYRYFPDGSIHLVVVDPGVGSKRRAILVKTDNHFFIGPDNGVFTFVYESEEIRTVVQLTEKRYFLSDVSNTFHGRDIFAPVAAHLSLGVPLEDLGEPCNDVVRIDIPKPDIKRDGVKGILFYVDRFGNLVSNIREGLLAESSLRRRCKVFVGEEVIDGIKESYSEVNEGETLALFGSSGYLEISVRDRNARERLGLCKGTDVEVVY